MPEPTIDELVDQLAAEQATPVEDYEVCFLADFDGAKRGEVITHRDAYVFLSKGMAKPVNQRSIDYCQANGLTDAELFKRLKSSLDAKRGLVRKPDGAPG